MDETALATHATEATRIGRSTLHRLSKLSWKRVVRELSAEGGVAAKQIYNLLKSSAAMGEWDLFEEAIESIPDKCMNHVIRDPRDRFDLFLMASKSNKVHSDVLLSIIRSFPSLRAHKDEDGNTLLHMLCDDSSPAEHVVKCIDEFCAFRLQQKAMQNNIGHTPLHYAMRFSSIDVIRKITDAFPEMVTMKDNNECATPLHFLFEREETGIDTLRVIEAQVDAAASVVRSQDDSGATPLHYYFAWRGIGHSDSIKALLKADPSAAICLDNAGITPLHDFCNNYCESECQLSNDPPAEYRKESFGDFWQHLSMLLLAATKGCLSRQAIANRDEERWKEIDAIVDLGKLVPWSLFVMAVWKHFGNPENPDADGMLPLHYMAKGPIEWKEVDSDSFFPIPSILKEYPDSVKMQDLKGRLPLHIAAACKYHKDDEGSIEGNNATNITRLVAAYPQGVDTKTRFGSFPLHLALKSKKHWSPDVRCILEAAPKVLLKPDPCSRLYPFMLAAVGEKASESVVYELLRREPSLIEMGVRETEDEMYLKRRIIDMESKLHGMENENNEMKSRLERYLFS